MWHDTFLPSWMSFSFSAVLTSDRKLLKHSIFSSAGVRRWGLWSRLRPRPSKRLVPTRVPSSPANSVPSTPSPPWLGRVSFLSLRKCQASQELFCYQDVFVRWMPNVTHCHTWHDWLKGCLKASPVEPWRIHNHDIYKKKKKKLTLRCSHRLFFSICHQGMSFMLMFFVDMSFKQRFSSSLVRRTCLCNFWNPGKRSRLVRTS